MCIILSSLFFGIITTVQMIFFKCSHISPPLDQTRWPPRQRHIFFSNSKWPLPLPLSPGATSMLCMETLLHLINGHHHHHQDLFLMNYCEISYSQVNSPGGCYLFFLLPCGAGYTESLMGRRRWFPRVHHKAAVIRAQAERQAVNFCVQGQRRPLFSRLLLWEL